MPSGTEIGEGCYHGETYGAELADLAYKGLGGTFPLHSRAFSTAPSTCFAFCDFNGCCKEFHFISFRHASSTIHSRPKQVTNPPTEERLQHPLHNDVTIIQIYNAQHYTTLITDNDKYYYYDGLGIAVPTTVPHLHDNLRQWCRVSTKPTILRLEAPTVHTTYTPQQIDGWSCAMHMLLTSLSTIY